MVVYYGTSEKGTPSPNETFDVPLFVGSHSTTIESRINLLLRQPLGSKVVVTVWGAFFTHTSCWFHIQTLPPSSLSLSLSLSLLLVYSHICGQHPYIHLVLYIVKNMVLLYSPSSSTPSPYLFFLLLNRLKLLPVLLTFISLLALLSFPLPSSLPLSLSLSCIAPRTK